MKQGKGYREFRRRVPRLWPALRPCMQASGAKPRWGQALRGEAFMWGFALAIAAFGITFNVYVLWSLLGAALVIFLEEQVVHNRRSKRAAQLS